MLSNPLAHLRTTIGHRDLAFKNGEQMLVFFASLFYRIKHVRPIGSIKFGGQTNPICLMVQCPFSESIWRSLESQIGVGFQPLPSCLYRRLKTWWSNMLSEGRPEQMEAKIRLQKMIYVAWNIWKERCQCVYDNKALTAMDCCLVSSGRP
jgi:hypothetical protein